MKRPTIGTVYAVYWPAEQVLKVGIMWRDSRIRHMVDTGGEVLMMMRDSPAGWEPYALRELAKRDVHGDRRRERQDVARGRRALRPADVHLREELEEHIIWVALL